MNNASDGVPEDLEGKITADLARWIEYKQSKAHAFIDRRYSVEWRPNDDRSMTVYVPQRHLADEPEIQAFTEFSEKPSPHGINNGRITKLAIQTRYVDLAKVIRGRESARVELLYNYNRGDDLDELPPGSDAERLFHDVIDVLN